ncbi:MAG: alpha/beta hydrolase [Gammaproteobacteria bacterium]|jgi:pimeloyl-ACP methyl ester carboxylesterase|nr:alpha/beta hydrolase [Gammaproteobacteria bacterium]MBT6073680.1 alpha/beta hydrolase [Gammaproteobacteria bacterium]MBT7753023.1 alpha/beta hydrolase [Gammaproteobacteria bacterium]
MNRRDLIIGASALSLAVSIKSETTNKEIFNQKQREGNMSNLFKHNYLRLDDGVPLFYIDEGQGRPIVLIHNLMFGAEYFWQKNIPELSQNNRVIAVDMRGHGLSGKPNAGYNLKQLASDINEILIKLDLHDVVLGGMAIGALSILQYLSDYENERVSALILSEFTPKLVSAIDWKHPTFGDFPEEAAAGFSDSVRADRDVLNNFVIAGFNQMPNDEILEEMLINTYLTPTEVVAEFVDDMVKNDYRDMLHTITLPTLLLYGGDKNQVFPTAVGDWIQKEIPHSQLVIFNNSGHAPFWEESKKYNRSIIDFVSK